MSDDNTLLRRAKAGDLEALAQIHKDYYDAIFRYLTFRVADPQTAEDLASEVFIRFLAAIRASSNPPNTVKGWLYGAANNVLKEHYRGQKRMELVELGESISVNEPGPEQRVQQQQARSQLQSAIARLTEEQQSVLALRFGFGLPIRDVAEVLNKSEGSIKMLQARAIMALTGRLAAEEVTL